MGLFIDSLVIPSAEDPLPLWQGLSITVRQLPERPQSPPLRLQSSIVHHPVHAAVASLPKLEHLSHGLLTRRILHTFVEIIALVIVTNQLSND